MRARVSPYTSCRAQRSGRGRDASDDSGGEQAHLREAPDRPRSEVRDHSCARLRMPGEEFGRIPHVHGEANGGVVRALLEEVLDLEQNVTPSRREERNVHFLPR